MSWLMNVSHMNYKLNNETQNVYDVAFCKNLKNAQFWFVVLVFASHFIFACAMN